MEYDANINIVIRNYLNEEIFQEILYHPLLLRLKKISFLGTIDDVFNTRNSTSRYNHSVRCAYLASMFAKLHGITGELKYIIVLFNLLHDIGHAPFSHIAERFQTRHFHNVQSSFFICGKRGYKEVFPNSPPLSDLIKRLPNGDFILNMIIRILTGKLTDEEKKQYPIFQLISSPIDIDTLEGISRTAHSLNLEYVMPEEILDSFYFSPSKNLFFQKDKMELLESFWELKSHIYEKYVFNSNNQSAQAMANKAFRLVFDDKTDGMFPLLTDIVVEQRILDQPLAGHLWYMIKSKRFFLPFYNIDNIDNPEYLRKVSFLRYQYGLIEQIEEILAPKLGIDTNLRSPLILYLADYKKFICETLHPRLFDIRAYEFPWLFRAEQVGGGYFNIFVHPSVHSNLQGIKFPLKAFFSLIENFKGQDEKGEKLTSKHP